MIILRSVVQKLCVAKNCNPLVYLTQIYGKSNYKTSYYKLLLLLSVTKIT